MTNTSDNPEEINNNIDQEVNITIANLTYHNVFFLFYYYLE